MSEQPQRPRAFQAAPPPCGRRTLLGCGAAALCAPLAQLAGCAPRVDSPIAIDLPAPVNNIASVPLTRVPELLTAGGSVILHPAPAEPGGPPSPILAVNSSTQGLLAFGALCPHAGCEVAWDDARTEVVCPCHLSRFAADGAVLHPPALEGLDVYPIKIQRLTQVLTVDLGGNGGVFPDAQGGAVTFTLDQLPALQKIGGAVTGHARGVAFPLLAVRTGASSLAAFDARCTHLGCAVYGGGSLLICKCHGSLFELDGTVKLGPATRALTQLGVRFDGTTAAVTVG